jgi:hypothetical protein
MKRAKPPQPAGAQYAAPRYSPAGKAGLDGDGMTESQRTWLACIRVSAKVFFVLCVIGGLGWAYEIGEIPFVDTGSLKIGVVVGSAISGFISAVFLNMAGDILELKCFMKSRGGK